ncbi:MAG: helix-turn-helix transcriptional regulator [Microthrixaceae bacterium]
MTERSSDPTARALQLLSLLQIHRFWPGTELAERLGVSARTLRRDVERLRDLGYDVDATPGVAGGYRLAAGATLPPLLLDDEEAVAIAVGLRSASGASIEGIEETCVRTMAKLEQVLPDRLRRRVAALDEQIVSLRWTDDGPRVDPEDLALLSLACRDQEQVQFDYVARDAEPTRRLVEPHRLVSVGRRWYLVAFDVRRDGWRTFRLDRMTDVRRAGPRFTPREIPDGDAAAFVRRSLGARPLAHQVEVLVDGPTEQVEATCRWIGGEVTEVAGDGCRVVLRADTLEWIAMSLAHLAIDHPIQVHATPELQSVLTSLQDRLQIIPTEF